MSRDLKFHYIDLFCGAGGVTSGIHQAMIDNKRIAKVLACVNHDPNAIASHKKNHRCKHFIEDIVTMNERGLPRNQFQENVIFSLWASMECTNFSNAKGGKSREADSRSLADHMLRYIEWCQPDYFKFENVREFMSWGPLVIKTVKKKVDGVMVEYCPLHWNKTEKQYEPVMVPESRTKGQDYLRWVESIKALGYDYDFRLLNSANYGEHTSRVRMFGIFAKKGLPIVFPEPTHAKNPKEETLFSKKLKKWKAVKHVLDLDDEGESIFYRTRKKGPLDENSLKRIYKGLIKFVAGGEKQFLSKAFSGDPSSLNLSIEGPGGTITTIDHHQIVSANFLTKYRGNNQKTGANSGNSVDEPIPVIATSGQFGLVHAQQFIAQRNGQGEDRSSSLEDPAKTVTATGGNMELIQPEFLMNYQYKTDASSLENPSPTITTKDRMSLVQPQFIMKYYGSGGQWGSIEEPASSITTKDRFTIVNSQFLNIEYGKSIGRDINSPAPTVTGNPKINLVDVEQFIMNNFSCGGQLGDLQQPAHALQTVPKANLVSPQKFIFNGQYNNEAQSIEDPLGSVTASRHYHYLVNPQFNSPGSSVDQPAPVVIAMQNKRPLSLVSIETGQVHIVIYETDSEYMRKIKIFMAAYGIVDIKMRMLKIKELLRIQGFPETYHLVGSKADQKKFIGNAVTPKVPKRMVERLWRENHDFDRRKLQTYSQLKLAA